MEDKIVVIGNGSSGVLGKAIANLPDNVVVVDLEKQQPRELSYIEPYILENPYPIIEMFDAPKKFICKARHQYRLVDTIKEDKGNGYLVKEIWECQCGRRL